MFFHLQPKDALISDLNLRLIETYQAIKRDWEKVEQELWRLQRLHSREFYYAERSRKRKTLHTRAAQFLYLNRTCWNGLYRENLRGEFNVPIGTKSKIIDNSENFEEISIALANTTIVNADFEYSVDRARSGDLIFADPPYTTAHNHNGFIKYNQNIFRWDDQVRLRDSLQRAVERGAKVVVTNADHPSIHELYHGISSSHSLRRPSVISANSAHRGITTEAIFIMENL